MGRHNIFMIAFVAFYCVLLLINCNQGSSKQTSPHDRGQLDHKGADTLVVVLAFFNVDLVQTCLDSILQGANGKPFDGDVIVVQQPSPNTEAMTKMIEERRKTNTSNGAGILHHILSEDTPLFGQNWVMPFVHNLIEPSMFNMTCVSDGDVIMYGDWLVEVRYILDKYPEVYAAAVSLNPFNNIDTNYIEKGPVHEDFIEAITGMQMWCFRTHEFIRLFKSGIIIQDTYMNRWVREQKRKVVRTKRNELVHMMWSVYTEKISLHQDYLAYKKKVQEDGQLWKVAKRAEDANMTLVF